MTIGSNPRKKAGFTMSEVLVALGIIVILMAVAIPSVFALKKSLKLMELDACARQIFLASQNNLTGAKLGGTLEQFQTLGTPLPSEGLRYASKSGSSGDVSVLLPAGAIDATVAANFYTILYNPTSATVTDVFYAEEGFDAANAIGSLRGSDKKEARKAAMLGYYSGDNLDETVVEELEQPQITLVNNEELRVNVHINPKYLSSPMTLIIKVVDSDNESNFTSFTAGVDPAIFDKPDAGGNTSLILDALRASPIHFFDRVGAKIAPGANLKITATLSFTDPGNPSLPAASSTFTTNSLFAARTGDAVEIGCARHLQNLSDTYSSFAPDFTSSISAIQTDHIQWPTGLVFKPIETDNLNTYDGQEKKISDLYINSSDGVKFLPTGLFGSYAGRNPLTLRNIRISNPQIYGESSGALVGQAQSEVRISNCFVFAEGNTASATISGSGVGVGGLVGWNMEPVTIIDSGVGLTEVTGPTVGGLLGLCNGPLTIKNSYAAVDNLHATESSAALLIGDITYNSDVIVTSCYAVGNISAANGITSGFANLKNGSLTVSNSYCAASYLDESGQPLNATVNGFASAGSLYNCYYLKPVGAAVAAGTSGNQVTYSQLSGAALAGLSTQRLNAAQSHPYRSELIGKAYPFPALTNSAGGSIEHYGSWPVAPGIAAYMEKYSDGSYGLYYRTADAIEDTLDYAGDGTQKTIVEAGYGILVNGNEPILPEQIQSGDTKYTEADFAAPVPLETAVASYRYFAFTAQGLEKLDVPEASTGVSLTIDGAAYYLHPSFGRSVCDAQYLSELGHGDGDSSQAYNIRTPEQLDNMRKAGNITSGNERNIYFIQSHDIDASSLAAAGTHSITENQIFNGQNDKYEISGLTAPLFESVAGVVSRVSLKNARIADAGYIFAGTNSGTILGSVVADSVISAQKSAVSGFVSTNASSGKIENCHVIDTQVTSLTSAAAGFAYANSGSITGSSYKSLSSYDKATVTAPSFAAGFVITQKGSIAGCFAAGTADSDETASGFAYYNDGSISGSYANCIVNGDTSASGFVTTNIKTVTSSYAMLSVSSKGTSAGFSASSSGSYANCYAAVSELTGSTRYGFSSGASTIANCYYYNASGITDRWSTTADQLKKLEYAQMLTLKLADFTTSASGNTPFADENTGKTCPFPTLAALPHYGDWPQKPGGLPVGLVYYEQYADDSYGFYGYDLSGKLIDTLDYQNAKEIKSSSEGSRTVASLEAGYGVITDLTLDNSKITLTGGTAPLSPVGSPAALDGALLYRFDKAAAVRFPSVYSKEPHASTVRLKIADQTPLTYSANLCFAAAIAPENTPFGTEDNPLQIRTAFQFEAISRDVTATAYQLNDCRFVQSHDITCYDTTPMNTLIDGFRFDGRYKGTQNSFVGLPDSLFGAIQANTKISNVVIRETKLNWLLTGGDEFGVFAAINYGLIENCKVIDSSINASQNVAGFVGNNSSGGQIKNCAVYSTTSYSNSTVTRPNGTAAGFVVNNSGLIENCSFVGTVTGKNLSGFVYKNYYRGKILNCYSNSILKDSTSGKSQIAGFVGENIDNATIESSYYVGNISQTIPSSYMDFCVTSGFALKNTGQITGSYTAAEISSKNYSTYAFAPNGGSMLNCYYWNNPAFGSLSSGAGTAAEYAALTTGLDGLNTGAWRMSPQSHPFSKALQGKIFPFPHLALPEQFGDWPSNEGVLPSPDGRNLIGIFHYTRPNANSNQITLTAAALDCLEQNGNRFSVGNTLSSFVYPSATLSAGATTDIYPLLEGYGVFVAKEFWNELPGKVLFMSNNVPLDLNHDMQLDSSYYFIPFNYLLNPNNISYSHDGSASSDWTYSFQYNTNGTFSVTQNR